MRARTAPEASLQTDADIRKYRSPNPLAGSGARFLHHCYETSLHWIWRASRSIWGCSGDYGICGNGPTQSAT